MSLTPIKLLLFYSDLQKPHDRNDLSITASATPQESASIDMSWFYLCNVNAFFPKFQTDFEKFILNF